MGWMSKTVDVGTLIGKTITRIEKSTDQLILHTEDGKKYKMYHDQGCCESVEIEDICGKLSDLIGTPLTMAEAVESNENPKDEDYESFTWTFYKFATIKGYVTIRWYGESNGYYSESVEIEDITEQD